MERTMSVEDRIRKAEEIYYRRREGRIPVTEKIPVSETRKKDLKLFKKMIIQIIVCLLIYAIFYLIVNNNYIFSEDFTNKAREILSQDINITEIYSFVTNKANELLKQFQNEEPPTNEQTTDGGETPTNEENTGTEEPPTNSEEDIQNNDENIGGAESTDEEENVENAQVEETKTEESEEVQPLSQMEQDANYVKSTVNFIKPISGRISSKYGLRNPTTPTVPKNHTGTDIAAVTGTKIASATDGKVILVSSKGDFGNHLEIQVNDVIILYAHCNKIYVNEGDTITQGQEIAEVGSTGNTTGPHLHFEVRYQNRTIDPQMILEL